MDICTAKTFLKSVGNSGDPIVHNLRKEARDEPQFA